MAKRTMTKRFYVGSNRMVEGGDCNHFMRLLPEALEEAKQRLAKNDALTEVYVVEVVYVVRREVPPMIVEEVRRG